jgi:hypothetical protein
MVVGKPFSQGLYHALQLAEANASALAACVREYNPRTPLQLSQDSAAKLLRCLWSKDGLRQEEAGVPCIFLPSTARANAAGSSVLSGQLYSVGAVAVKDTTKTYDECPKRPFEMEYRRLMEKHRSARALDLYVRAPAFGTRIPVRSFCLAKAIRRRLSAL